MKVAIGKPNNPVRIMLRCRRQEDVDANLAADEVAVDVSGQAVRIDGLWISADGAGVVQAGAS